MSLVEGLAHGDPGLYALLLIVVLLVSVLGLVMRSIVRGDLVPSSTVDRWLVERDDRIVAQREALIELTGTNGTLAQTNKTQADSISDLASAQVLNVKVGEALRSQLEKGA